MEDVFKKLAEMLSELERIGEICADRPPPDSMHAQETTDYPTKKWINQSYSMGSMSLQMARDHVAVLPVAAAGNIFSLAVVARAVLEAASLAMWFFDPAIDATERVRRGIMQMCEGKAEIKKFYEACGLTKEVARTNDFFARRLPAILAAENLTFTSRKGNPVEPQALKPAVTDLLGKNFNGRMQAAYRIFSGIAHGQTNLIATFAYDFDRARSASGGIKFVEHKPKIEFVHYALKFSVPAFGQAVERHFRIFGWDYAPLAAAVKNFTDALEAEIAAVRV